MQGLIDLLASERGVAWLLLLAVTTVLFVMRLLGADQWIDFAKYITITLIASKTVTTAVETYVTKQPQNPPKTPPAEKPSTPA